MDEAEKERAQRELAIPSREEREGKLYWVKRG